MRDIVATAPPGGPSAPRHNGHRTTLITDELGTFDPRIAPRGTGTDPLFEMPDLDAAVEAGLAPVESWIDAMTEQGTIPPSAEVLAQQTRELEAEFRDLMALHDEQVEEDLIARLRDQARHSYAQLLDDKPQPCPAWCASIAADVHGDAFDTDPDTAEHRGVPRTVPALHGGVNGDRPGPAQIEAQLEQDRDRATGPAIALTLTVDQAEHTTWLTPAETRALRHVLDGLLDETEG